MFLVEDDVHAGMVRIGALETGAVEIRAHAHTAGKLGANGRHEFIAEFPEPCEASLPRSRPTVGDDLVAWHLAEKGGLDALCVGTVRRR